MSKNLNYFIVVPRLTQIRGQFYSFPIGIAYVSSSLKKTGRNVTVCNLNYKQGEIVDLLRPVIEANEIDVVVTGGLTAQYWQIKEITDAAKFIKSDIITVVGGGLITSDPEAGMAALETADFGVIGEGEITICELADSLEGKLVKENVPGLIYPDGENWHITAQRPEIMDLDDLPYPDYEAMEFGAVLDSLPTDIYGLGKGRFGFVSFGRSCPFNCTFCFHPSGTKYRRRSMDSVFKELDFLIEKFDIRNVAITDELFVAKIEDVKEFCERIKERHIGFVISLRVDMVRKDMLLLLRDAGCLSVGFGLESADNNILKSMRKHITVEQIDNALSICHEIGLNAMGNFIFGDQEETVETYQNTLRWWREHPQYLIALHLIVLYPGSVLYKIACKRGLIKDKVQFIKDGCPYVNISKLTDDEYRKMAVEISFVSQQRTEYVKNADVKYLGFGKVDLIAECPVCGHRQTWGGLDAFRSLGNLVCESCNHAMNVIVADYKHEVIRANFEKIKGKKIAIWPMICVVEEMCHIMPEIISDEDIVFIDSAKQKQGMDYKGKIIMPPATLAGKNIEYVFVTLTTSVATEIIKDIKRNYPMVKKNYFAGDLINADFNLYA